LNQTRFDGDLYVSGGDTLVRAKLAVNLVDELHLLVYPLTPGAGLRLFPDEATPRTLSLAACESYEHRGLPRLPTAGVRPLRQDAAAPTKASATHVTA
jgi:dihydrofolate reductase